jgi:hypothetical protein
MSRIHRVCALLLAAGATAFALPATSHAACGFLGLQRCPPPPPQPDRVESDGSLRVSANPYDLKPLPLVERGEPLYPRDGHLYFGMTDNAVDEGTATPDEVGGMVEALGGSVVRIGLYWPEIESRRDTYNWSRYDNQYLTFIRHGVRPLWAVFQTPRFAAPADARCFGQSGYVCDSEPADTLDASEELEEFAHALARRYPLAAGFEYRNEPNLDKNKACTTDPSWWIDPEVYTANLVTFADSVHSARPEMRVLGGALSSCHYWDRTRRYLAAMLDDEAQEAVDGISVHFSGGVDGSLGPEMKDYASVLARAGEEDVRLVAGEVGYNGDDTAAATRLWSEYYSLNVQDPALAMSANYDMFVGFVVLEHNDKGTRSFGWVRRKDFLGRFQAKRAFCDFRQSLGAGRPLPSYMRNCMLG